MKIEQWTTGGDFSRRRVPHSSRAARFAQRRQRPLENDISSGRREPVLIFKSRLRLLERELRVEHFLDAGLSLDQVGPAVVVELGVALQALR